MTLLEPYVWEKLGIAQTSDERSIKRAYAKLLKQNRPDEDPVAFQQLREAYERALKLAVYLAEQEQEDAEQEELESAPEPVVPAVTNLATAIPPDAAQNATPSASSEQIEAPASVRLHARNLGLAPRPLPPLESQATQALTEAHVDDALDQTANEANTSAPEAQTENEPESPPDHPENLLSREEIELSATPHEIASQIWQDFVGQNDVLLASSLPRILARPELLNLDVRDAFEFYCAQYCADENADSAMRKNIVEFFEWPKDFSHLAKMHPVIPRLALERYYADEGFHYLNSLRKNGNTCLQLLMADTLPHSFFQLANRKFTREMRDTIHHLQWKFPEVVRLKLKEEVFETWAKRVAEKRYFYQTFFTSIVFGIAFYLLFDFALIHLQWLDEVNRTMTSFGLGQALAVGGFAWFSLHPPEHLIARYNYLRSNVLYKPIEVYRFEKRFQAGWMLPVLLMPLLLMGKEVGNLTTYFIGVLSVISLLFGVYATSVTFAWQRYLLVPAIGLFFSMYFSALGQAHIDGWPTFFLGSCFALLVLRGSDEIHKIMQIEAHLYRKLRIGWCLLIALFWTFASTTKFASLMQWKSAFPYLVWLLLCVPGLMLVDFRMRFETIFRILISIGFSSVTCIHLSAYIPDELNDANLLLPLYFLILQTWAAIVNTLAEADI